MKRVEVVGALKKIKVLKTSSIGVIVEEIVKIGGVSIDWLAKIISKCIKLSVAPEVRKTA